MKKSGKQNLKANTISLGIRILTAYIDLNCVICNTVLDDVNIANGKIEEARTRFVKLLEQLARTVWIDLKYVKENSKTEPGINIRNQMLRFVKELQDINDNKIEADPGRLADILYDILVVAYKKINI